METIGKIRRRGLRDGESISGLARSLQLSRNTVRKYLKEGIDPVYRRKHQVEPQLGPWRDLLDDWLSRDVLLPKARRRTARRLFECLQAEGYGGAYDSIQRHVRQWKTEAGRQASTTAFVPLFFAPGDVAQFDWSHEHVVLGGVGMPIKVAQFRLAYSRQMFVVAYPREAQEMVLDAHNRAFAFFGGVPRKVVSVRISADTIRVVAGGEIVARHQRQFGRNQLICEPWHYLSILETKPGALRHGLPFANWKLPAAVEAVRVHALKQVKGDRTFAELLLVARETGLEALDVACQLAQEQGHLNTAVVLNELRRLTSPPRTCTMATPDALVLLLEPAANCARYDELRKLGHGEVAHV